MKITNEHHFGSIIENISDVIAILAADGGIRFSNLPITANWRPRHDATS